MSVTDVHTESTKIQNIVRFDSANFNLTECEGVKSGLASYVLSSYVQVFV